MPSIKVFTAALLACVASASPALAQPQIKEWAPSKDSKKVAPVEQVKSISPPTKTAHQPAAWIYWPFEYPSNAKGVDRSAPIRGQKITSGTPVEFTMPSSPHVTADIFAGQLRTAGWNAQSEDYRCGGLCDGYAAVRDGWEAKVFCESNLVVKDHTTLPPDGCRVSISIRPEVVEVEKTKLEDQKSYQKLLVQQASHRTGRLKQSPRKKEPKVPNPADY